jgi:hypothetical protein
VNITRREHRKSSNRFSIVLIAIAPLYKKFWALIGSVSKIFLRAAFHQ